MIIRTTDAQARAILGSMRAIALAHGQGGVSDADTRTVDAAARVVLGRKDGVPAELAACSPERLAEVVGRDRDESMQAVRMLAVMSLVDGRVDQEKIELVEAYARAVGVDEAYLHVLADAAAGEIAAASACMIRKNAESFPMLNVEGIDADPVAPFLPYRDGNADPALVTRYETLQELTPDTFGRAFWNHFKRNGSAFPGDPNGLAEGFTTPHDSSHVLSGYSTSPLGELLVSTFIGAMHPDHPMAAEVLPVMFSWHLGIRLNDLAGSTTGGIQPEKFWTAWDRGHATTVDLLDPSWDFWAATQWPLQELRREYNVPAVDPMLIA